MAITNHQDISEIATLLFYNSNRTGRINTAETFRENQGNTPIVILEATER